MSECEKKIHEEMQERLDSIFPQLDSLNDCHGYYSDYNRNSTFQIFVKEATGLDLEDLIEEYEDSGSDESFSLWLWDEYGDDIVDFVNEARNEFVSELPLGVSKNLTYRIELSTGGPQDYFELDWDPEGEYWVGGSYHYLDWGDGARRTFGGDLAEELAEAFGIEGGG